LASGLHRAAHELMFGGVHTKPPFGGSLATLPAHMPVNY
jgi:hypothetical protein